MDSNAIRMKFGDDYLATEHTYVLGIDIRLATRIAGRFRGRSVLETCTGAGFTTMALAGVSRHVTTVEIEPEHLSQARANVTRAGLQDRVTFILGDVLDDSVLNGTGPFNAAFLDPDWAITGPDHIYRFRPSNMRPPADVLLGKVIGKTRNIALILPPSLDLQETKDLPPHECQRLFLGGRHELYCLYFGDLATVHGQTELHGE